MNKILIILLGSFGVLGCFFLAAFGGYVSSALGVVLSFVLGFFVSYFLARI